MSEALGLVDVAGAYICVPGLRRTEYERLLALLRSARIELSPISRADLILLDRRALRMSKVRAAALLAVQAGKVVVLYSGAVEEHYELEVSLAQYGGVAPELRQELCKAFEGVLAA